MEEGLVLPTLVIRPGKELVIFKIGIEKDRLGLLAQVEEGIEASLRGISERPSCFFTKGMCKGALEAIFGEKISIEEVNCRTIGHDFCEFIVNY
ncbi:MAG: 4-vinyl reductase [Candidatus Korarchaeum sp.]